MKPFIVLFAVVLGVGAVGATLAIQSSRFALASDQQKYSPITQAPQLQTPRVALPSRTIYLDEVLVIGEFEPQPEPTRRHARVLAATAP